MAEAQANAGQKPPNPHDTLRYAMLDYMNSLVMSSTKLSDEEKEGLVRTRISHAALPPSSPSSATLLSQLKNGERNRGRQCQEPADPEKLHVLTQSCVPRTWAWRCKMVGARREIV